MKYSIRSIIFVTIVFPRLCFSQATSASGGQLLAPQDLFPALSDSLRTMGGRMSSPDKAQITLGGTITDGNGSRAAQITVQAPGLLAYREGQGRAIVFDGTHFLTKSGAPAVSDYAVLESLLANLPDAIFLQLAYGGGLRRIGSHFRTDDGKSKNYSGPYWTVFAFTPKTRLGLGQGIALQQSLFIAIDERTGLISDVRAVVNLGAGQQSVIQTQFSDWTQQGSQWIPGKIIRLENGNQTLSFQTQQASVGPALGLTAFQP